MEKNKEKINKLANWLSELPSRAFLCAEQAAFQMKKRIFQQGLRSDLKPIGKYQTGGRRGRSVKLKNTGELEKSLAVVSTKKGAIILANKNKVQWNELRYGKIFAFSKEEKQLIMSYIKKY